MTTWSEREYADPVPYLRHRAELVLSLGPPLQPGDRLCDLACGDGGLAEPLLAYGIEYVGVDLSPAMVEAARRRLGDRAEIHQADLNDFEPPGPVSVTTCFSSSSFWRSCGRSLPM